MKLSQGGTQGFLSVNCNRTNPLAQAPDRRGSGAYCNLGRRWLDRAGDGEDAADLDYDTSATSHPDTDDFFSCLDDAEGTSGVNDGEAAAAEEEAAHREFERQMDIDMQPILG